MRVLGIDPGVMGALALVTDNSADIFDMPVRDLKRGRSIKDEVDPHALRRIVAEIKPDVAWLEKVGGIRGQAAGAAFNFGRGVGMIEGVLVSLDVPIERVAPLVWMKAMRAVGSKTASRARACDLFPAIAEKFKRVKDDGRADAVLIARYGLSKQQGIFG
jgi:crossover junction endodeoxyribonuclease RuvC